MTASSSRFLRLIFFATMAMILSDLAAEQPHTTRVAPIGCGYVRQKETGNVPYFSSVGRRIAICADVPPPPITFTSLAKVDPPRNGSARSWVSPICQIWQDTKFQCQKNAGKVSCVKSSSVNKNSHSPVVCTQPASMEVVNRYCAEYAETNIKHYEHYDENNSHFGGAMHIYQFVPKRGWTTHNIGESNLPSPRKNINNGRFIHLEKDFSCKKSHLKTEEDQVYIDVRGYK